jgi:hypothetical protein
MRRCQQLLKKKSGSKYESEWDSCPADPDNLCNKPANFQLGEHRRNKDGSYKDYCMGYWVCAEHYDEYMNSGDSK